MFIRRRVLIVTLSLVALSIIATSLQAQEEDKQGSAGGMPWTGIELRGAPIKAVTWHDLAIVEVPDGWWARIIFDV